MSMTSVWMVTNLYVAFFSTSSGSSIVESVIRIKGVSFRRVLKKNANHSSSEDGQGKVGRTNKCLPLTASMIFRDRSTSRADSSSFASAVWLLDATTRPRSSKVPISLYWCNPWNLAECVVSNIFRYSLLIISTTDISRDTVFVDGWKQAEVLDVGDVLAGGTDISDKTGKVSNTTRLQSEASC